jgi:hypothetical protein
MTFEQQCFVHPSDIIGIEIKCSKCGYRWTRPIGSWLQDSVNCANCTQQWFINNSGDLKRLKEFVTSILAMTELAGRSEALGFSLRLEVKCPDEKE